jgi:hypothetical protein
MAFWKRKKEEPNVPIQSLFDSGAIKELERAILKSTETTEKSVKAFQEMSKALNNNTRELKKGFTK